MKRHKCANKDNSQKLITSLVDTPTTVTKDEKSRITNACVNFPCQDLRPFETVGGAGFENLVQELFKLQHKHKALLKASDILPHPTTVSRQVADKAKNVKSELSTILQDAFSSGHVSFTSDMWTDAHKQRSYLTVTAHWIDSNWNLCSRVICTEEFDPTEKKTGVNIRSALAKIFSNMGVTESQLKRSVFTTDCGSNMIVALKEEERLDCAAHVLNTVLRHTFDDKKDCQEAIGRLITACKALVRYIKKTSLQNLLKKGVVQSCETR